MNRNLMLSWLAAQSKNAAVTPTDMYRAKLGMINEIAPAKPKPSPADTEHARVQGLIRDAAKTTAIEAERAKRRAQFGGGSSPDSIKESRSRGPDGYKGGREGKEGTRKPKDSDDESGEETGGGMFDVFDEKPKGGKGKGKK